MIWKEAVVLMHSHFGEQSSSYKTELRCSSLDFAAPPENLGKFLNAFCVNLCICKTLITFVNLC